MPTFGPDEAEVLVFTFKKGLLSPVAHDLKLRVGAFTIEVDDGVVATVDPGSIEVVCAMKKGEEHPGTLSEDDRQAIEATVRDDVLRVEEHPTLRFESTRIAPRGGDAWRVQGEVTLHGTTRTVSGTARRQGDRVLCQTTLHQPDFGITPYRAMMGALQVRADVEVRVALPASALPAG